MMIINVEDKDKQAMKSALREWISSARADATSYELADLYHTSVFANAAARYWANKIQSVPFQLVAPNGDIVEKVPTGHPAFPIMEILDSPTFSDYLMRTETTLRFWGYSMALKNRNVYGRARNLEWVNPFLYQQQGNAVQGLIGFHVYAGRYQDIQTGYYPLEDTVYLKEGLNFDDDSKGTSSAEVAFLQASASVEIAMAQYASFKNFAIPATVFQPEAVTNGSQFATAPSEQDRDSVLNYMKRLFKGARNAGKTMVSSVRWQVIQLSPPWKDSLPVEQDKNLRESVAAAFDLPIEFLTTGQTTYAELEGKTYLWIEDRFIPRLQWYASQLTQQLCNDEGLVGYWIQPDLSNVMKNLEAKRIENTDKKLKSGYISITDAQEELGLPVIDSFKGLYHVDGVGLVPESEVANIWKYKLQPDKATIEQDTNQLSNIISGNNKRQCAAITGDGSQCENFALPNSLYCGQHQGYSEKSLQSPIKLSDFKVENSALKSSDLSPDEIRLIEFDRMRNEVPKSVFNEINIVTRKGLKGQSFTPDALNLETMTYINHLIDEACQQDDIVHYALKHYLSVKARAYVAPIRAEFERRIDAIFKSAVQGKYSRSGFIGAITPIIRSAIQDSAIAGLRDGGLKNPELTEDEQLWIDNWIDQQDVFIQNVATAIYEDEKVTEKEAEGKATLWWNKSIDPAYSQMVYEASKNGAFLRRLGATEQHCVDCVKIDGQVRRASFWHSIGIWNASSKTQCGGWRCECQNVPTDLPITRGRFPKIVGSGT